MIDSTTSASSDTSAPASTPAVDPGSTSTPASTPDTSGPAVSIDDAFAAHGLTGSPNPADAAPAPPAPASTIEKPVAPVADAVTAAPETQGPIPFERHQAILQNTRQKAAEEVVGRVQQHYGAAIEFQSRLQSDPQGTLTQLIDEVVSDPNLGPQMMSHLARTLSQRRGQKALNEEPQPDLLTTDGDLVFSAGQYQKREAWLRQQMAEEVNQRLAPIEQERQRQAEAAALERRSQETRQTVTTRLSEWQKRPGFRDHQQAIAVKQSEYVRAGLDTWSALGLAYADIYTERVLPKVQADSQTTLVKSAFAKAQGSTSHPGQVAPSTMPRPRSIDEAFRQVGLGR